MSSNVVRYLLMLMLGMSHVCACQTIDFSAYSNITNTDFENFVNLFSQKALPLTTDVLLAEQNLQDLSMSAIPDSMIDQFLKENNQYVIPELYNMVLEDGQQDYPMMGSFYPLYKLPTNGDYVILVIAQIDDFETHNRVNVLSFDLNGNYLHYLNRIYSSPSTYLNNSIDSNLISVYNYVIYGDGSSSSPKEDEFDADEGNLTYQILPNGTSQKMSFSRTPGTFIWNTDERRYEKVD